MSRPSRVLQDRTRTLRRTVQEQNILHFTVLKGISFKGALFASQHSDCGFVDPLRNLRVSEPTGKAGQQVLRVLFSVCSEQIMNVPVRHVYCMLSWDKVLAEGYNLCIFRSPVRFSSHAVALYLQVQLMNEVHVYLQPEDVANRGFALSDFALLHIPHSCIARTVPVRSQHLGYLQKMGSPAQFNGIHLFCARICCFSVCVLRCACTCVRVCNCMLENLSQVNETAFIWLLSKKRILCIQIHGIVLA